MALLNAKKIVAIFPDEARKGRTMAPLFGRPPHDRGTSRSLRSWRVGAARRSSSPTAGGLAARAFISLSKRPSSCPSRARACWTTSPFSMRRSSRLS